jgi:hypothetical protein
LIKNREKREIPGLGRENGAGFERQRRKMKKMRGARVFKQIT